jgi:glycine/D-amino acid oxidase-like deaminating enzyme/nitrite reductase/ring-hydroxylating ferredoxin subunit
LSIYDVRFAILKERAMENTGGRSVSIWHAELGAPSYPPLDRPIRADVAVVGAGIAGLSTAYQLAKRGLKVAVLDDGPVGGGDTGRTTAQLTAILDKGYAETEQLRGRDGARLAAESHMAAITTIEQAAAAEGIACDFARMDGYLFLAPGDRPDTLKEEEQAARRAGLEVELLAGVAPGGANLGPALRFARQGHFHPLKYLAGLARAVERLGGAIYCGSHVSKVIGGDVCALETTDGQTVSADKIVIATHMPINDALGYSTRIFPYLTYVVGLSVAKGSLPPFLAFDTAEPYHYVRIQPEAGRDVLLVGGEDHKTGQADDQDKRYGRLEAWTRRMFPAAGELVYRWSGEVTNAFDGLALAGPDIVSRNVYVITGQSGIGMTHSTIGALIVADQIVGRANPWAELYDPARLPARALGESIRDGLNVAAQYTQLLRGGDVASEAEIPAGSGAVVGWGPMKQAVYRDEAGALHRRSAICTHLGCVVAWNDSEKTWDCPCHGSRYDAKGRVINGPAPSDLGQV